MSLRRSRVLGCHATLPPKRRERCVTSQKTAAEGRFRYVKNIALHSTLHRRNLNTELYFYGWAYHTNPDRKRSVSKTLFKPEEFEIAGFSFSCARKAFLKTELFESDGVVIMCFSRRQIPKLPLIVAFSNSLRCEPFFIKI